ncbi:MAG: DNA helicase RecQ [Spirochaetota bacterium]
MSYLEDAKLLLKEIFGYNEFRPLQEEVITHVLQKKDTLVIMPTGGGKSLCYQIPALLFPGLTLVVSPLISLMKDQVEQLQEMGVAAGFLNSSLDYETYYDTSQQVKKGKLRLLYLAPETLFLGKTLELLSSVSIDCISIDEAHCISEWGHDFRPEYRKLAELKAKFPGSVWIALTATATPQVQKDIANSLEFPVNQQFLASFNRENLYLEILPKTNPLTQTLEFLQSFSGEAGIIYCYSRKQVDQLCQALQKQRFLAKPYHAGLSDFERNENQTAFLKDEIQIIVATVAFGMGINKPNIRFVLHYDLPKNIESYYQQIGRAGRDGLPAHCLLLFSYGDIAKVKYFIEQKEEQEKQIANKLLQSLLRYVESEECRRVPLLHYFGEDSYTGPCQNCDVCLSSKYENQDITLESRKFLSCMYRTQQKFGMNYIIDVLRGSKSKKIVQFGHDSISTYGIGRDVSKEQWLKIGHTLLHRGIARKEEPYGSLVFTEKSRPVLKQEVQVFLKKKKERNDLSKKKSETAEVVEGLLDILKKKRKQIAQAGSLPPYAVFPDKTLLEMASLFPTTETALLSIYGVGRVKANVYGEEFLALIREYCSERGISRENGDSPQLAPSDSGKTKRYIEICEKFNSGVSLDRLLVEYKIQEKTLLAHFHQYLLDGFRLQSAQAFIDRCQLSPQQVEEVLDVFQRLSTERLKPVFSYLREKVSYEDLTLLRIYFLHMQ